MKKKLIEIMDKFHQYNSDNMAYLAFGLDKNEHYDALVVAPSYSPYKLKMDSYCKVTTLKEGAYIAGYLVEKDDLKIAWIKTASSDSNLIELKNGFLLSETRNINKCREPYGLFKTEYQKVSLNS